MVEAKRILDDALATPAGREHPGVLHLYLHTMEMSATPQDALPAADLLRGLVPDAGHLQHMPSHIDVLCGNYRDSVVSNLAAVQADRRFVEREGPLNFYSLYRAHNLHFMVYSAMFEGHRRSRCEAADELAGQLTPELLAIESPPMADWLEAFVPLRIHVLVRFGRWDELIAEPLPDDLDAVLQHRGHHPLRPRRGARREGPAGAGARRTRGVRRGLRPHPGNPIPVQQHRPRHPGHRRRRCSTAKSPTGKADSTMRSPSCGGRSNSTTRFPYDEPWGWMQPTRHAYGALLLEQGHVEEAAAGVRGRPRARPDAGRPCQHPGNVWSLHGYHECLQTARAATAEAAIIGQQLELVRARADVPILASCACRLEVADA